MPFLRRAADLVFDKEHRSPVELPGAPVDPGWFGAATCRNCGAAVETPYCGQCGQKAARRFVWRDVWREGWDRLRWFEFQLTRTLRHLATGPGRVAREYVMGRRTAHMHPIKLLVALVAVLVLMLAANRYFGVHAFRDAQVDQMAARVMAYANWSFSIGIFAIFLGSWIGLNGRLGYNWIEHAVLAIYVQCLILAVIIVNMLPTLVWRDAGFVLAHKAASQAYMPVVKLGLVAVAYHQFFLIDLRHGWPRWLLACLIYAALAWGLLRLYAAAILWLVTR